MTAMGHDDEGHHDEEKHNPMMELIYAIGE